MSTILPPKAPPVSVADLTIRRMRESDVVQILPIESVSFGRQHWSDESFINEMNNAIGRYYVLTHRVPMQGSESAPPMAQPPDRVHDLENIPPMAQLPDRVHDLENIPPMAQPPDRVHDLENIPPMAQPSDRVHGSETVIGYAGIWMVLDEGHLTTIAVAPEYRGQSLGELLLVHTLDYLMARIIHTYTLEVRSSNTGAQELYLKYGFEILGTRPKYYQDTKEDGLIMTVPNILDPAYRTRIAELKGKLIQKLGGALPVGCGQ
jgi:ribosomal-protein-alanine acetyltransferase